MHGKIDYTVPNRIPIPIGDRSGAKAIAHWLGNDIQYSLASVDRWLTTFSAIAQGTRNPGYQGTGNAFSVFASATIILLESEHVNSHKVCLSVSHVSAALEHYRMFLSSNYKSPDYQPTPFDVEFLAEENDACEYYSKHGGTKA